MLVPEDKWTPHLGEIWDYEKVFYQVLLADGTFRWAYPNAGKLIDVGFTETSGQEIPIETVDSYREAEDDYYSHMETRREKRNKRGR